MINDTFAGSKVRHGTASGWSKHRNLGEAPCPACWAAKSEYDKRWRSAPAKTKQGRLAARAQGRALMRLKDMYPDVWKSLYAEEKQKLSTEVA